MRPAPGAVVAWWDGNALAFGTVAGEEKQRVRLVLAGGREERVLPGRIAFEVVPPDGGVADRAAQAARAAAVTARVETLAATVDVRLLWEIAHDAEGDVDVEGLAGLAIGRTGNLEHAAVTLALVRDGVHFTRHGDEWEPRGRAAVAEIERQNARTAERRGERLRLVNAVTAVVRGGAWEPSGSETEQKALRAVEELAVLDRDASDTARELALTILDEARVAGDRPAERAFRLLRKVGVFRSDDENLHARRLGLAEVFPERVLEHAEVVARAGWNVDQRSDLTGLELITIDSPTTREIDDGLSHQQTAAGARIGIHIADPAAFVLPRDPVDEEAWARGGSHYMPDLRVPMLPPIISENAASLIAGETRPALSIFVDVLPSGEWSAFEIQRSLVRSSARLDYDEADRAIVSGEGPHAKLLQALAEVGSALERRRVARGALILRAPEVDVRVINGNVVLEPLEPNSAARRLVSEAMILAGEVAARFCIDRALACVFRRQPTPAEPQSIPPGRESDPVIVRSVRRSLRRGEVSVQPGPHHALGLTAYTQVTSPLRRYQDLVVHRQITTALSDVPPPYGIAELTTIAATTDRAELAARDAERAANRYWLLRHLEQSTSKTVTGIVVDLNPTTVQLRETLLEERVPSLTAVALGDEVTLLIERTNPRADILMLRPA